MDVVKLISNINFLSLKQICLPNCSIESLEQMNKINMPNVISISLRDNKITCVSSLRKLANRLEEIVLDGNRIEEIDKISEINTANIVKIYLDFV